MDENTWNPLENTPDDTVWFKDIIIRKIYRCRLPFWKEEMAKQYVTSEDPSVRVTAIALHRWVLHSRIEIASGEKFTLSFWKAIYKKWKTCPAMQRNLDVKQPVDISFVRIDGKRWKILTIQQGVELDDGTKATI